MVSRPNRARQTLPKSCDIVSSDEFQNSFQVISSNATGACSRSACNTSHSIIVPPLMS